MFGLDVKQPGFHGGGAPQSPQKACQPKHQFPLDEVCEALNISEDTPVIHCDVRDQDSSMQALITLVKHLLSSLG